MNNFENIEDQLDKLVDKLVKERKHVKATTCSFCDNLVYANKGWLPKTPTCSPECRKKLAFKISEVRDFRITEQASTA